MKTCRQHHAFLQSHQCDEQVPCLRCVKRGEECSLLASSVPEAPPPANSSVAGRSVKVRGSQNDEAFTIADIKLFHHFTTTTCHLLANPHSTSPWLDRIPALALDHPFLLHEVMAVAAVELSHNDDDDDATTAATRLGAGPGGYLELARLHHARALAGLMPAITSQSTDLVAPVWACNSLFVPYYFATAVDVGSLLFTARPPGPAEWMLPLRGGVTLFKTHEDVLLNGLLGLHLRPYQDRCREGEEAVSSNLSESNVMQMIGQLRLHGEMTAEEGKEVEEQEQEQEHERTVMTQVFQLLRQCFAISDRGDAMGRKTACLTFCAMAPGEFFELLGRKRRAAWVVMAFWCLLLHRAEQGNWWLGFRKVRDLMEYIVKLLGPEAAELIRWPVEEMRFYSSQVEA